MIGLLQSHLLELQQNVVLETNVIINMLRVKKGLALARGSKMNSLEVALLRLPQLHLRPLPSPLILISR